MIGGGHGPLAGGAYSMWTLVSAGSDVKGPYEPDPDAYRLSGQDSGATKNFGQVCTIVCIDYLMVVFRGSTRTDL